jgi:hypothetical protein
LLSPLWTKISFGTRIPDNLHLNFHEDHQGWWLEVCAIPRSMCQGGGDEGGLLHHPLSISTAFKDKKNEINDRYSQKRALSEAAFAGPVLCQIMQVRL